MANVPYRPPNMMTATAEDADRHSIDSTASRSSQSRMRKHLASYSLISRPYHFIDDYTPFHIPSRIVQNVPDLPSSIDSTIDSSLTAVDRLVEAQVMAAKQSWDRWITRPQERVRTGVGVYTEWSKSQISGSIRKLEENILDVGEYFLPSEPDDEDDHMHAHMNGYWTSTESMIDSDEERSEKGSIKNFEIKDGKLAPLTPASGSPKKKRTSSAPSLPPFKPDQPTQELQNVQNLIWTYAKRTYSRNAHKSPSEMMHDALDLAKSEVLRALDDIDKKFSFEKKYWQKMVEVRRKDV